MSGGADRTGSVGYQRVGLILVALGAMAVSIVGQVQSIEPTIGWVLAGTLALTNDIGALLALDAALSAEHGSSTRKWSWLAILLAAGTGATLNTWHAVVEKVPTPGCAPAPGVECVKVLPELPWWLGLTIGLEPILLVLVLSHLLGLVVASRRDASPAGARQGASPAAGMPTGAGPGTTVFIPSAPAPGASRQTAGAPAGAHQSAPVRQPAASASAPAASTAGTHQPASRPSQPALPAASSTRQTVRPARALAAVPGPRHSWMTNELIERAVELIRADQKIGRPRLMRELGIKDHEVKKLRDFIDHHNLLRESA